jgi:large subunit ribosomal protein L4
MKLDVLTMDGKKDGSVDLSESIFGLTPREDLLQRYIRWQLAKRQRGTHKTLGRSEINRSGKKIVRQKGSGGARHGSARAPQFRGGGRSFGPVVRDHAIDLPKKIRALALKHALSSKAQGSQIIVLKDANLSEPKTKALVGQLDKLGLGNVLIIDGFALDDNFSLAARNLPNVDVLPVQGINVYDILRRDKLVLTRAALGALEERLS